MTIEESNAKAMKMAATTSIPTLCPVVNASSTTAPYQDGQALI
jgi:hypothetical protein